MAPCWVSTGSLEAGRWQRCPRPPGTPHPPEPQPCCTQTRGDVALHSHEGTQASKHWGRGYPQAGHPGHLPGCACAPAARLRPLTSRLCSAVPGKADYAPALQLSFSPASPPASLRCLARPGGTGGLLGRVWGVIPMVGANLHSGAHSGSAPPSPSHPGECLVPEAPRGISESLPHIPSPLSWGLLAQLAQFLATHPRVSQGVRGHPASPHPWWVMSPSPGCGAERDPWGGPFAAGVQHSTPKSPWTAMTTAHSVGRVQLYFDSGRKYRQ